MNTKNNMITEEKLKTMLQPKGYESKIKLYTPLTKFNLQRHKDIRIFAEEK